MPTWLAKVTLNRDYPPRPNPGVLHLSLGPVHASCAADYTDVTRPADLAAFVASHMEIGSVIVYDSRFPRREVTWRKFVGRYARIIWDDGEMLAAFEDELAKRAAATAAETAKRVSDPDYTPTVSEALRHPKEFVDGMREE